MKIDLITITVLKNFAKINPSILIKEGNLLRTVSPTKTTAGEAVVPTTFNKQFAIYNLDRFLSAASLFDDPDFDFDDKFVTISNGNTSTQYMYADEDTIKKVSDKKLVLPSIDASFDLSFNNYKSVEKALGVLNLPEIAICGDGKNISILAIDTKNPTSDVHSIKIGETDKTFRAIFKSENIKILPMDYHVDISSKGFAHFQSDNIEYWIAVEQSSTF